MATKHGKQGPERARRPWLPSDRAMDAIERAIAEGAFDNLPGKGQPLDLSDDNSPFVPDDMRLAYRILRNAGVRLPWIEERKIIDASRANLEREIERHVRWLHGEIENLGRIPAYLRPTRLARLRAQHLGFLDRSTRTIDEINKKINLYNLSVPVVSAQIFPLNPDKVLGPAKVEIPSPAPNP